MTYKLVDAEAKPQPGENMVQFNFIEPVASDLVRIPAGSRHDSYHDLTKPTASKYQVALELATSAFLHSDGPTLEETL